MKKCSICGKEKEESEFHKCKKNPDGLDYRCKQCCHNYWIEKRKNPMIRKRLNQKKREWNKKNYVYKKKKGLEYYYSNIDKYKENYQKRKFNGRILGTQSIGSHIRKDIYENYDFDRESEIIKREKNQIFLNGNTRKCIYNQIKIWNKKEIISSNFTLYTLRTLFTSVKCPVCGEGIFVIPNIVRTYDYSDDGFIMPFCNNCGVVYNV